MPKCSLPHSHKPCISLTNSKPAGERLYETFGGTSPVTVRRTTPSRSSCRNCAVSTFSLIFASRLASSAKRFGPNAKFHSIDTFHLPRITATVACTGQPCVPFTLQPPLLSKDSKSLRRFLPVQNRASADYRLPVPESNKYRLTNLCVLLSTRTTRYAKPHARSYASLSKSRVAFEFNHRERPTNHDSGHGSIGHGRWCGVARVARAPSGPARHV